MPGNGNILVATTGSGVVVSRDNGEMWFEPQPPQGMHSEAIIRSLAQDPRNPEIVYAGSELGLYRSDDSGGTWQMLNTPMNGNCVWSLAIDPVNPDIMYAGVGTPGTPGLYRSTDGSKMWERLEADISPECQNIGIPRPTQIAIDPTDHLSVWVGVEVEGVRHSTDGGDTWTRIDGVLTNPMEGDVYGHNMYDLHNMHVAIGPPKTVMAIVYDDIWMSSDEGATWTAIGFGDLFTMGPPPVSTYIHGIAAKPGDPRVLFLAVGNHVNGSGAVMRSRDAGRTWEKITMPVETNSPIWALHTNPADPDLVLAGTRFGYVYRSDDAGDSWTKLRRELSGINAIVWVPN